MDGLWVGKFSEGSVLSVCRHEKERYAQHQIGRTVDRLERHVNTVRTAQYGQKKTML